jgi:hypothetical protein
MSSLFSGQPAVQSMGHSRKRSLPRDCRVGPGIRASAVVNWVCCAGAGSGSGRTPSTTCPTRTTDRGHRADVADQPVSLGEKP